jgi:hypothetical protein
MPTSDLAAAIMQEFDDDFYERIGYARQTTGLRRLAHRISHARQRFRTHPCVGALTAGVARTAQRSFVIKISNECRLGGISSKA